ncbi:MAG: hypothetical protein GQ572_02660 [Gammaproteobacteria bacterium]|nr:hypothetical protein [Gammaproteobacteria bacterium]
MQFLISFFLLTVIFSSSAFAEENISTRHIPLDGQANFRDIGAYKTTDGLIVKRGLIYRSGELGRLSDKDVERLHVLLIYDLLIITSSRNYSHFFGNLYSSRMAMSLS